MFFATGLKCGHVVGGIVFDCSFTLGVDSCVVIVKHCIVKWIVVGFGDRIIVVWFQRVIDVDWYSYGFS